MAEIQPFTHPDLEGLPGLSPPDWGDVTPAFQQYLKHEFCHAIKLTDQGTMIGVGAGINHGTTGWLAHIIVHPDFRANGHGGQMTQFLIDALKSQGAQTILLNATELGERVYSRLGFSLETQYIFYQCDNVKSEITITDRIEPWTKDYREQVFLLDRVVSGEDRRAWLEPHLSATLLFVDHGEVRGFYVPGLGDGLIYALDQKAGGELMERRFLDHKYAVVPVDNKYATSLLDRRDGVIFRTARRMWIGPRHSWRPECVYNRISGALG